MACRGPAARSPLHAILRIQPQDIVRSISLQTLQYPSDKEKSITMGLLSARPLNCAHGYFQFWSERTCEVVIPVFRADGSLRALRKEKGHIQSYLPAAVNGLTITFLTHIGNGVHDCRAIYGKGSLIGRGVVL